MLLLFSLSYSASSSLSFTSLFSVTNFSAAVFSISVFLLVVIGPFGDIFLPSAKNIPVFNMLLPTP